MGYNPPPPHIRRQSVVPPPPPPKRYAPGESRVEHKPSEKKDDGWSIVNLVMAAVLFDWI